MMNKVLAFLRGEEGLETAEYALLLVLLAIAAVAGASVLGGSISTKFNNVANSINGTNTTLP